MSEVLTPISFTPEKAAEPIGSEVLENLRDFQKGHVERFTAHFPLNIGSDEVNRLHHEAHEIFFTAAGLSFEAVGNEVHAHSRNGTCLEVDFMRFDDGSLFGVHYTGRQPGESMSGSAA